MAQPIELTEFQQCVWDAPLDHGQLQALAAAHISVSPSVDREGAHLLRPSSWVGAVNIGDRSVIVRPKILVDRVMFLMTYALDPKHWRNEATDLAPDADVLEAVALAFAHRTQQAVHRGLLRGYRREEDALNTVREVRSGLPTRSGVVTGSRCPSRWPTTNIPRTSSRTDSSRLPSTGWPTLRSVPSPRGGRSAGCVPPLTSCSSARMRQEPCPRSDTPAWMSTTGQRWSWRA